MHKATLGPLYSTIFIYRYVSCRGIRSFDRNFHTSILFYAGAEQEQDTISISQEGVAIDNKLSTTRITLYYDIKHVFDIEHVIHTLTNKLKPNIGYLYLVKVAYKHSDEQEILYVMLDIQRRFEFISYDDRESFLSLHNYL